MDAIKGLIERKVYVEAVIDFLTQMSNKQFGFSLQKLGRCYDKQKGPTCALEVSGVGQANQ